ncbi:DEAD/DEAH box helicase [Sphingomonas sp. RB3P16]|uniref:DEAD/DEAH box helicase n=1 Tax=Parasphingomonas frigoris TaxID=3096163 RepID=UPI002FC8C7E5
MTLPPREGLLASIATGTWPDISPFTVLPLDPALFHPGLHWWQYDLLVQVATLFRAGYRRVLLQAATGAGKTVMALSALRSARMQGLDAQFLVHRKELLKQTSKTFTSAALDHSFVAASFPFDRSAGLLLSGVQTLVNRLDGLLPPVLVIVDEAHHAVSNTYAEILERWPDAFILLLTATPERLDGRGLCEQADAIVLGPPPRWLIDYGYLSDFDIYAPDIPDFSDVPTSAGEYQAGAADRVMNKPKLIGNVVEHYLELGGGGQGIVFGQSRDHSRKLAEAFTANGIPAMHVDGTTGTTERDYFDDAFRAGDIRIGTNCDLFAEGYDVPNISYLGDASRSKSKIKVKQRHGRVLRFIPGKRAVICDHAGNVMPSQFGGQGHGLPDEDYVYTLEGRAKGKTSVNDDATPITQCTNCFLVYPSSAPCCPRCSVDRPAVPRIIREEAGKLTKIEKEQLRRSLAITRKKEEWSCNSFSEMISLGVARGYDHPTAWARRQCKFRGIPLMTDKALAREFEGISDYD